MVLALLCALTGVVAASEMSTNSPVPHLQAVFVAAQQKYQEHPDDGEVAWKFARACFDRAEFPTNSAQRAALAKLGIEAAHKAIAQNKSAAAAHYYLAMNYGQLARTKTLGALRLVDEMEEEFKRARELDESFDHAGPDRNLGRLYFQAPAFASIGSQKKAREHFKRAAELAPDYPENRLNLIESAIRWKEYARARRELQALEETMESARARFSGTDWIAAWIDWDARLERVRTALPPQEAEPSHP